jgi:hypothetical protein
MKSNSENLSSAEYGCPVPKDCDLRGGKPHYQDEEGFRICETCAKEIIDARK